MNVVVVTPAWNEAASIASVVEHTIQQGYRVVVVDDGSRDDTASRARAVGATVLRHPFNLGVGAALQTGFREALRLGADAAVQVDADGQHTADQIPLLTEALGGAVQMVVGSRFVHSAPPRSLRGVAMRTLARRASRIAGGTLTDASSGYRAIGRPLLQLFAQRFPSSYLGDTFGSILLAARYGFEVREVSVTMRERQAGQPSTGSTRSVLLVARAIASSMTTETKRT